MCVLCIEMCTAKLVHTRVLSYGIAIVACPKLRVSGENMMTPYPSLQHASHALAAGGHQKAAKKWQPDLLPASHGFRGKRAREEAAAGRGEDEAVNDEAIAAGSWRHAFER